VEVRGSTNPTRGGRHCSRLLGHDENDGTRWGEERHGCSWHPSMTRCHARTDKCAQTYNKTKTGQKKNGHLPTCKGPLSTSWLSSSTWTSFSKRCRLYWMGTSRSAPTNQGRVSHFIGVCRHALESRSVKTNMQDNVSMGVGMGEGGGGGGKRSRTWWRIKREE
jgi:hypothetical protein